MRKFIIYRKPVTNILAERKIAIFIFYCLITNYHTLSDLKGLPGDSDGKESACNTGDPGSIPGSGTSPWRKEWQPSLIFLSEEFHGQRSLACYSPWGRKESDTTEQLKLSLYFQ